MGKRLRWKQSPLSCAALCTAVEDSPVVTSSEAESVEQVPAIGVDSTPPDSDSLGVGRCRVCDTYIVRFVRPGHTRKLCGSCLQDLFPGQSRTLRVQRQQKKCQECKVTPKNEHCGKYCARCFKAKFASEHAAWLRSLAEKRRMYRERLPEVHAARCAWQRLRRRNRKCRAWKLW